MKKLAAIFLSVICSLLFIDVNNTWYNEWSVFGKTYICETPKSQVVIDTFTVSDISGKFSLIVKNSSNGTNSRPLDQWQTDPRPRGLPQRVDVVTRHIILEKSNEIKVELPPSFHQFVIRDFVGGLDTCLLSAKGRKQHET